MRMLVRAFGAAPTALRSAATVVRFLRGMRRQRRVAASPRTTFTERAFSLQSDDDNLANQCDTSNGESLKKSSV